MTEHIAEAIKDMSDTSADRAIGYAEWNENEARSLRLYRADNPSMPELAEMHEETATTLRALLAERDRLKDALLIADAACRSYWGWEYGRPGDVDDDDVPDSSLLKKWRRDYDARAAFGEDRT